MSSSTAFRQFLLKFFVNAFDREDLRLFLQLSPHGEQLVGMLPGDSVVWEQFAHAAVAALLKLGSIDASFFQRLREARPGRPEEVRQLEELWRGIGLPPPPPTPPRRPLRWQWGLAVLGLLLVVTGIVAWFLHNERPVPVRSQGEAQAGWGLLGSLPDVLGVPIDEGVHVWTIQPPFERHHDNFPALASKSDHFYPGGWFFLFQNLGPSPAPLRALVSTGGVRFRLAPTTPDDLEVVFQCVEGNQGPYGHCDGYLLGVGALPAGGQLLLVSDGDLPKGKAEIRQVDTEGTPISQHRLEDLLSRFTRRDANVARLVDYLDGPDGWIPMASVAAHLSHNHLEKTFEDLCFFAALPGTDDYLRAAVLTGFSAAVDKPAGWETCFSSAFERLTTESIIRDEAKALRSAMGDAERRVLVQLVGDGTPVMIYHLLWGRLADSEQDTCEGVLGPLAGEPSPKLPRWLDRQIADAVFWEEGLGLALRTWRCPGVPDATKAQIEQALCKECLRSHSKNRESPGGTYQSRSDDCSAVLSSWIGSEPEQAARAREAVWACFDGEDRSQPQARLLQAIPPSEPRWRVEVGALLEQGDRGMWKHLVMLAQKKKLPELVPLVQRYQSAFTDDQDPDAVAELLKTYAALGVEVDSKALRRLALGPDEKGAMAVLGQLDMASWPLEEAYAFWNDLAPLGRQARYGPLKQRLEGAPGEVTRLTAWIRRDAVGMAPNLKQAQTWLRLLDVLPDVERLTLQSEFIRSPSPVLRAALLSMNSRYTEPAEGYLDAAISLLATDDAEMRLLAAGKLGSYLEGGQLDSAQDGAVRNALRGLLVDAAPELVVKAGKGLCLVGDPLLDPWLGAAVEQQPALAIDILWYCSYEMDNPAGAENPRGQVLQWIYQLLPSADLSACNTMANRIAGACPAGGDDALRLASQREDDCSKTAKKALLVYQQGCP